ncbi:hypothetical protein Taro_047548 [Colocasia esculenta]|uniref:Uncharacterized protein n=1 Tax=Colocasia esculenta TaxID=4460 RepID=A0A843X784_COLES|nr:hypothetical protein [Colocasia esculenta]
MEDSGCSGFFSNLLCQEDETCLDGGEEEEEEERGEGGGLVFVKDSALSETEDEYIGILVSRESSSFESHGSAGFSHSDASTAVAAGDWLKCARSGAVRWILKTRTYFGFSHRTAYLSVIYLDRFFVKRTIEKGQSWAIQLLSVACLSLAAKMEECRVPALTEYPVAEYHFDGKAIQRMELLVLNTLEWRMSSINPFLYLNYFASKFGGQDGGNDVFSRAVGFIFSAVEGMNLVDYRPSAIAAAAIFAASGQPLTKTLLEDKMGAISTCRSLEIDHTLSCYNMMMQESQRAQKEQKPHKILMPTVMTSSSCPNMPSSGDDAIDGSCLSALCCKRRRLATSSYACNCRISNKNNTD